MPGIPPGGPPDGKPPAGVPVSGASGHHFGFLSWAEKWRASLYPSSMSSTCRTGTVRSSSTCSTLTIFSTSVPPGMVCRRGTGVSTLIVSLAFTKSFWMR